MQLTEVPGIGPAFAQRLKDVGVHDAESLAQATDVSALAEAAGIPKARLEASVLQARMRLEAQADSGIAIELRESALERRLAEAAGYALTLKEWALEKVGRLQVPRLGKGGRAA